MQGKHTTYFSLQSVITLFFGLGSLFASTMFWQLYGMEMTDTGLLAGRLMAVLTLGYAGIWWLLRDAEPSNLYRSILKLGGVLWFALGALVLWAVWTGIANKMGLGTVACGLIFGVGNLRIGSGK
jgi:hypothetical protein